MPLICFFFFLQRKGCALWGGLSRLPRHVIFGTGFPLNLFVGYASFSERHKKDTAVSGFRLVASVLRGWFFFYCASEKSVSNALKHCKCTSQASSLQMRTRWGYTKNSL